MKKDLFRTFYFAFFDSHLRYGCQVWGQIESLAFKNLETIQNKTIRLISFKCPLESSKPLYKNQKIFQLTDIVKLNNNQLVFDQISKNLPGVFE